MVMAQINLNFGRIIDENRSTKNGVKGLEPSPELYAAIDKRFGRRGSRSSESSFLERGVYTTYGSKRICLAYPETKVTIFGKYLMVEVTTPTSRGDVKKVTYYTVR